MASSLLYGLLLPLILSCVDPLFTSALKNRKKKNPALPLGSKDNFYSPTPGPCEYKAASASTLQSLAPSTSISLVSDWKGSQQLVVTKGAPVNKVPFEYFVSQNPQKLIMDPNKIQIPVVAVKRSDNDHIYASLSEKPSLQSFIPQDSDFDSGSVTTEANSDFEFPDVEKYRANSLVNLENVITNNPVIIRFPQSLRQMSEVSSQKSALGKIKGSEIQVTDSSSTDSWSSTEKVVAKLPPRRRAISPPRDAMSSLSMNDLDRLESRRNNETTSSSSTDLPNRPSRLARRIRRMELPAEDRKQRNKPTRLKRRDKIKRTKAHLDHEMAQTRGLWSDTNMRASMPELCQKRGEVFCGPKMVGSVYKTASINDVDSATYSIVSGFRPSGKKIFISEYL